MVVKPSFRNTGQEIKYDFKKANEKERTYTPSQKTPA